MQSSGRGTSYAGSRCASISTLSQVGGRIGANSPITRDSSDKGLRCVRQSICTGNAESTTDIGRHTRSPAGTWPLSTTKPVKIMSPMPTGIPNNCFASAAFMPMRTGICGLWSKGSSTTCEQRAEIQLLSSIILDAGCGPGTWLRRVVTHAHRLGFSKITARGFDVALAQVQGCPAVGARSRQTSGREPHVRGSRSPGPAARTGHVRRHYSLSLQRSQPPAGLRPPESRIRARTSDQGAFHHHSALDRQHAYRVRRFDRRSQTIQNSTIVWTGARSSSATNAVLQ
jgi:hypothetical protein